MFNPFNSSDQKKGSANSADPDEMAHYEPSHQDLHCLQNLPLFCHYSVCHLFSTFIYMMSLTEIVDTFKFIAGIVHFRNSGVKELKHITKLSKRHQQI